MDATRSVFILLTKHTDNLSQFLRVLYRGYYSHASIGFDEEKGLFYSFTRRGFLTEYPEKICQNRKDVECVLYRINVSQQAYDSMRKQLASFYECSEEWKFNILGFFFGIVKFPFLKRKYKRFCSQFVAEILEAGGEVYLHKRSTVVFPDDFTRASLPAAFWGTLEGLVKHAY